MEKRNAKIFITSTSSVGVPDCHFDVNANPHYQQFTCNTTKLWYQRYAMPYAIVTTSVVQITIFVTATPRLVKHLRFEPSKEYEIWRLVTYMFLHDSWYHILLNVVIQCLFAATLEKFQGCLRVFLLYIAGGVAGALGAACARPDVVVGSSAGVYALLLSHLSHILLNYDYTKYKICRCAAIGVILVSDISYSISHVQLNGDPTISWGAHIGGAVAGFFLGLVLYKSKETYSDNKTQSRTLFWLGIVICATLVVFILVLQYFIHKCTPKVLIRIRYVYTC